MNIRIKAFMMIIIAAACWASCKKNNDKPQTRLTTNVNFINASNNTINFYFNGTRINNTTSYFPGGTLGYVVVTAGLQNFQVKLAGPANPNALFTLPLTLDSAKKYSLYVSGQTADGVFFTKDTATSASNFAKIRFVNASPDAGPLVLAFTGRDASGNITSSPQFSNIAYKTTTSYIRVTVPANNNIFNLSVYRLGSTDTPKADTVTLNTGGIYTLVGYGTIGSAGNRALGASLIVN